jgi:hypothetical protein
MRMPSEVAVSVQLITVRRWPSPSEARKSRSDVVAQQVNPLSSHLQNR